MSGAECVSHNEAHNSLQHCRMRPTGGLLVYTRPAYSVVSRKGWHKMTAKQDLSSSGCWWWWWSGGVEWLAGWLTAGDDVAIWNGSSSIEFYFYYFIFIHLMLMIVNFVTESHFVLAGTHSIQIGMNNGCAKTYKHMAEDARPLFMRRKKKMAWCGSVR